MKKLHSLLWTTLAVGVASTLGLAQIVEYTLPEIVEAADGAVYGEIIASQVFEQQQSPEDAPAYFTTLTIEGRSLSDGTAVVLDVTYQGGFVSETEGYWNSEAPPADDVLVGNRVVVFHSWADDLGKGVSANTIHALHGGIYRTAESGARPVALGKGVGYALEDNISIDELEVAIQRVQRATR